MQDLHLFRLFYHQYPVSVLFSAWIIRRWISGLLSDGTCVNHMRGLYPITLLWKF